MKGHLHLVKELLTVGADCRQEHLMQLDLRQIYEIAILLYVGLWEVDCAKLLNTMDTKRWLNCYVERRPWSLLPIIITKLFITTSTFAHKLTADVYGIVDHDEHM